MYLKRGFSHSYYSVEWEWGIQSSPSTPSTQTLVNSNLAPTSHQNRFPLDFPLNSFLYNFTLDNSTHVLSGWQVEKKCDDVRNITFISHFKTTAYSLSFFFSQPSFKLSVQPCLNIIKRIAVPDPDLEKRGGGWSARPWDKGRGAPVSKIFFRPFGPQFGLKIRVDGGVGGGGGIIVVFLPHPFPYFRLFASNSR